MLKHAFHKKAKKHEEEPEAPEAPVLSEDDEAFLQRIAEEGPPPPLPSRRPALPERPLDLPIAGESQANDLQLVLADEAKEVPLPDGPDTSLAAPSATEEDKNIREDERPTSSSGKKKKRWSFLRRDSRDSKRKSQKATASDLMSAAEHIKPPDAQPNEDGNVSDQEAKKEEEEMASVLEQLNLAAVDNRVFSISKESQELLYKFKFVLKDLVNGVPTAYGDLESLLTNSEDQIQRGYEHLPSFLQKLIKQLPSKVTQSVGPEMLAAAAEKHGLHSKYTDHAAHAAEKMGVKVRVPSLKDLVTKPGAVAGMLKAIMNFLKLRFPAFLGMNVLYSLALFVLLFVFWYCHKRGRETRLEKERASTEAQIAAMDEEEPTESRSQEAGYAPEGSLAKEMAKEKAPKPSQVAHTKPEHQGT